VHDDCSAEPWYEPTLQLVHADARLLEYCPAVQLLQLVDSAGAKKPGEQSPHVVAVFFTPV
jgi:hypothetical protein